MFGFEAKAGEEWIVEVKAARNKSPLDSHVAILDSEGNPVPRVQLQAVRDTYFTFRGKDSNTTGDFRLHNWEEMRLNQYLYSSGEVVKLFHYPRQFTMEEALLQLQLPLMNAVMWFSMQQRIIC